ncbi:MAG: hypothetical protein ABIG11_01760 [bacterium]
MRRLRDRRGQTAVEYILVTLVLFVAFAMMYRLLNEAVGKQFKGGAAVVVRMYQ